jgi:hypothetical protein
VLNITSTDTDWLSSLVKMNIGYANTYKKTVAFNVDITYNNMTTIDNINYFAFNVGDPLFKLGNYERTAVKYSISGYLIVYNKSQELEKE